jgi:hypothetical protein
VETIVAVEETFEESSSRRKTEAKKNQNRSEVETLFGLISCDSDTVLELDEESEKNQLNCGILEEHLIRLEG